MAPNKKRNAGRQLLIFRNRLKTETDIAKIASLRRREANMLLELGQRDEAVAVAASLVDSNSDGGSSHAFLADILACAGRWLQAEENFVISHRLCVESGRTEKAISLASGPLFLLAEAREDYQRCLAIAPTDLLRNRAVRLSGGTASVIDSPELSPWKELFLVERVYSGVSPEILDGILDYWKAGEAEWRWRILYEGAALVSNFGKPAKQWSIYLKKTGMRVLDPRYFKERRILKRLL